MASDVCKSCNVPFEDHLGLIGTCRDLQHVRSTLSQRDAEISYLRKQLDEAEERVNKLEAELEAANNVIESNDY